MLSWSITFFIVALIAGVLGFFGIASAAAGIANAAGQRTLDVARVLGQAFHASPAFDARVHELIGRVFDTLAAAGHGGLRGVDQAAHAGAEVRGALREMARLIRDEDQRAL